MTTELVPIADAAPEQPVAAIRWHEEAADLLHERGDYHRWEAARLIAEELEGGRKTQPQLATEVGKSQQHVSQMRAVWDVYGDRFNNPDSKNDLQSFNFLYKRAPRILRDRDAESRRILQAKKDADQSGVETVVDIRHGDFREELADVVSVDAIITDPPYPAEYLPLLADLAAWADKVLTDDGVLAVLMGQTHLPEVYRLLNGHRPYRWTGCYLTPGNGYSSQARRLQSNWKPLLIYGGGPRFSDIIRSEGTDADAKNNHHWGQDYSAFHTIIERLTERGQTVVDPFMGGGTTLLAAHALGRHAIGCDVDAEHVAKTRERLGG